jgi:hypothetical protein
MEDEISRALGPTRMEEIANPYTILFENVKERVNLREIDGRMILKCKKKHVAIKWTEFCLKGPVMGSFEHGNESGLIQDGKFIDHYQLFTKDHSP